MSTYCGGEEEDDTNREPEIGDEQTEDKPPFNTLDTVGSEWRDPKAREGDPLNPFDT